MRLNVINKTAFEEKENEFRYHDLCFYDHYRQERDQKVSPSLEVEIKVSEDNLARAWSMCTVPLLSRCHGLQITIELLNHRILFHPASCSSVCTMLLTCLPPMKIHMVFSFRMSVCCFAGCGIFRYLELHLICCSPEIYKLIICIETLSTL